MSVVDSDIDGLLDQLDGPQGGQGGDSFDASVVPDGKKKEKKKKKERSYAANDVEMGALSYNTPQSTYQAGSSGAASGSYGAAPVSNPFGGQGGMQQAGETTHFNSGINQPSGPEFNWCAAENQDLVMNGGLLLAFCGFEAVFGMMTGSHILLLDFFRRLGGVFAMVYTLEMTQIQRDTVNVHGRIVSRSSTKAIHECTDPTEQRAKMDTAALQLRHGERRRLIIATLMIAIYLLTVGFMGSMGAIIAMYGGAPPQVKMGTYILMSGLLCLALDLVHLKYGVEVHLGNDVDENSGYTQTMFVATFGSLFVVAEGTLVSFTSMGGYVDPFLCIAMCGVIAVGSSEVLQNMASSLQYCTWQERI